MAEFRIVSSSGTQEVTGSIAKILSLGANDAESSITLEFGNMTFPENHPVSASLSFTPTTVINAITVPAGSYIDGPIGRAKVQTGAFLFYLNIQ